MDCQYLHIEAYGRKGARGKSGERRYSAANIVAELMRIPGACGHVSDPALPVILYGMHPDNVLAVAEERASLAVDAMGRKLRIDATILLAGVISWPAFMKDIKSDPGEREMYEAYLADSIAWLHRRYGENLMSCILHEDEGRGHMHFLVVPTLPSDGRMSIASVHPGLEARKKAEAAGANRKTCDKAYCTAMSRLQDEFFLKVASKYALDRFGPRRNRLTRAEWHIVDKHRREFVAERALIERKAAEREARLRAEMYGREHEHGHEMATAVAATRQEMLHKAETTVRRYFEHLLKRQNDLSRELVERDSLIAEKDDELAELRALLEGHGIATFVKKR